MSMICKSVWGFVISLVLVGFGPGLTYAQSAPPRWIPESGWYGEFVASGLGGPLGDRGRGVYLETQGEIAVLTIMTYEADGRPVMLYAAGPLRFEVSCTGMSAATTVQFQSCLRDVDLYRVSGGVPLGQRGMPIQPPRTAEAVGRINLDVSMARIRLEVRPSTPSTQPPPPGSWPDSMTLQRLQWGYAGFGGDFPSGWLAAGGTFAAPGACIPDFRGDWVLVEPANRGREAQRLVFDQVEQVVPNFNCGLVATPEDAARIFVVFRDTQRQVELRCRASGCGYWEQGTYSGWVERGYGLKRFQVAVGVPDGGQIPTTPLSFRAGRLVAYRVE
jgi:hypothetical protein